MRHLFWGLIFSIVATPTWALDLSDITNKNAVAGLKQALTAGVATGIVKKVFGALQ